MKKCVLVPCPYPFLFCFLPSNMVYYAESKNLYFCISVIFHSGPLGIPVMQVICKPSRQTNLCQLGGGGTLSPLTTILLSQCKQWHCPQPRSANCTVYRCIHTSREQKSVQAELGMTCIQGSLKLDERHSSNLLPLIGMPVPCISPTS